MNEDSKTKLIAGKWILVSVICAFAILVIANAIYLASAPTIKDGQIQRSYTELLEFLEEEPENLESKPYENNIPKQVEQDIRRMRESEDLIICYTDETEKSCIRIREVNGKITLDLEASAYTYVQIYDFFSMYKTDESIVIYGSTFSSSRSIERYEIKVKTGTIWPEFAIETYVDLWGVEETGFENIRAYSTNMTLTQKGNEFKFYYLGEQIGNTVIFPYGRIERFSNYYIINDKQELYYLYYSSNQRNPWIEFVKVDENVSGIEEKRVETDRDIRYPVYQKDGKRYVGVSRPETELFFGQNYGDNNWFSLKEDVDFSIQVIELDKVLADQITLTRTSHLSILYQNADWCIQYSYQANGQCVYEKQRVNGIDAYLTDKIPEYELEMFNEKIINAEQIEETINQLRELYARYEQAEKELEWTPISGSTPILFVISVFMI